MLLKFFFFGLLLLLASFHFLLLCIAGKSIGVCISKGGRFPPFSIEGKAPRKVSKGSRDLTLCRLFRRKTCCDVAQTYPALLSIRRLMVTGEASQDCLQLWELLECSICNPNIGVQPGPPLVCDSFCDRVYQACSSAYFSMDATTQVLAPCGVNDLICGRGSEWVSNGTELCQVAGFSVKLSDDPEDSSCYGGKASLDSIADSMKESRSDFSQEPDPRVLGTFQQLMMEMPFIERVSWAVGGMVLTAGLMFVSKRKSHSQQMKLEAIQRTARKIDSRSNLKSRLIPGDRKSGRR